MFISPSRRNFLRMISFLPLLLEFAVAQDFNISETGHAHFRPAVAADSSGAFVVVWADARTSIENGGPDSGTAIYGQRYSADRIPLGKNFRISDPVQGGGQRGASISMAPEGDFLVTWHGPSRLGGRGETDVYLRRYARDSEPRGPSFRVSNDPGSSAQLDARIALQPDGSFLVTWLDRREGPLFSYAQFFDSSGTPRGNNFRVNSNGVEAVAIPGAFEDGRFFLVWSHYLQLYGPSGMPLGGVIDIHLEGLPSSLGRDSVLIIWRPPPELSTIYGRLIRIDGTFLGDSLRIDDDSLYRPKLGMALARAPRTGQVMIVWEDHRNDVPGAIGRGDIYAQCFDKWGEPRGGNFKFNHEPEERDQTLPATAFSNTSVIAVWLEDQSPVRCPPPGLVGPGIGNIVGGMQPFDAPLPGAVFGWRTRLNPCPPTGDVLLASAYPNPSTTKTTISFSLPSDDFVDITVYDLLGREIQQLVHGSLAANRYQVDFQVSNLASGIYFYRVSTSQASVSRSLVVTK